MAATKRCLSFLPALICKLDRLCGEVKKIISMKWSNLQEKFSKISKNFFIGLAL
jgi:hypothetical protein